MPRSTFLKNLIGLYEIAACFGNGEVMRANLSAAAFFAVLPVLRVASNYRGNQ